MLTLLAIPIAIYLLWVHYAAVMRLLQVRDAGKLTKAIKLIGYPALAIGLVLDFAVQVLICTLLFLELPKEFTVSGRLWRLSNDGSGWRKALALWLRVNLLDALDPSGIHKG